jgi:hypothetical protein
MKKFMVERILPGADTLTKQELEIIARSLGQVPYSMVRNFHWLQSFITEDKIYCIHIANDAAELREHARFAKLPIHSIAEIKRIIDPSDSES